MQTNFRFICPALNLSKRERLSILQKQIEVWVNSDNLKKLVEMFGGKIPELSLKEQIEYLENFSEKWDYRRKQSSELQNNERWNIKTDDDFVEENTRNIMKLVEGLGLTNTTTPIINPDYILPLGGARMANLYRSQYSYDLSITCKKEPTIVGLSGMRPINNIEKEAIITYAPDAKTEFDAMCYGIKEAFSLTQPFIEEQKHKEENINLCWSINKYEKANIYIIAAPSSLPERRADSVDTFEFFIEKFSICEGDSILLVTSPVYVPFQFMRFIPIAIEKNLIIDCVGTPYSGQNFLKTSSYLQEIKSTINAIESFLSSPF